MSRLAVEMLQVSKGVRLVTYFLNADIHKCVVPDDWLNSVIVKVFEIQGTLWKEKIIRV